MFTGNLNKNVHGTFIHNGQKLEMAQISSIRKGIKQTKYIHTVEHNSAINRNELLINATMWMSLKHYSD